MAVFLHKVFTVHRRFGPGTHENGQAIATYDSQDKLQSWRGTTYQYNAAGDLTQKRGAAGTSTYRYDSQGNLRQVTLEDGRRIDYAIDPDNRRVGKKINGQLQWQMVWQDSLRPIARLKADGSLEATYYYADSPNVPAAMSKGGKTYRIITDHLGSVRMVMDAETGEVAQRMNYDAWGQVVMDTNPGFQPFGFAGGLYDPDTRLTRFGARDYDAEVGRWTAKDPILFNGGDSNLYGYVFQSPMNFKDPIGLWVGAALKCVWDAAGGYLAGDALQAAWRDFNDMRRKREQANKKPPCDEGEQRPPNSLNENSQFFADFVSAFSQQTSSFMFAGLNWISSGFSMSACRAIGLGGGLLAGDGSASDYVDSLTIDAANRLK